MARTKPLSTAEGLAIVKAKIEAAGGKISHNALVAQLDAEGNASVVLNIPNWFTKSGPLFPVIDVTQPPQERLSYRLRKPEETK